MKNCLLCGKQSERLAKSHIFSLGFFNKELTKARTFSVSPKGDGRKLASAIYDPEILCDECEHGIMQPLDDYAIKIIRDKKNSITIPLQSEPLYNMIVYEDVDKRMLRAFIASVLWRCSVSKQLELRHITVGSAYEGRMREDLLNNEIFPYIDMFLSYLTHPLHGAFFMPARQRLRPWDENMDSQNINGWILQLPNISITVSLDKRPHPHSIFYKLSTSLTEKNENLLVSTSLRDVEENFNLLAFETDVQKGHMEALQKIFMQDLKSEKYVSKGNI